MDWLYKSDIMQSPETFWLMVKIFFIAIAVLIIKKFWSDMVKIHKKVMEEDKAECWIYKEE